VAAALVDHGGSENDGLIVAKDYSKSPLHDDDACVANVLASFDLMWFVDFRYNPVEQKQRRACGQSQREVAVMTPAGERQEGEEAVGEMVCGRAF
jgi:hypothetical protein